MEVPVKTRIIALALATAALLLGPSAVLAHHGAATFDTVGEITLKGTVTEWVWSNPHSILRIDVKGEDGTVKNCPSPPPMSPTSPSAAGREKHSILATWSPCSFSPPKAAHRWG